ncbi:hypothetical protein T4E_4933 [Trichinella pseudospiralis]|uniref:Uncharacterized protein n=1 Tax=Trichinella pseudospiralis TaxID=6337 RepID=A0A0V0XPK3_TRIPS|nr:hypothetical protein T4E_4933 [Trichinella pseudospiralis]
MKTAINVSLKKIFKNELKLWATINRNERQNLRFHAYQQNDQRSADFKAKETGIHTVRHNY